METKRKRAIFLWNGPNEEAIYMVEEFRKRGIDIVYLLINEAHNLEIPGVVVHYIKDAHRWKPAVGINADSFDPPSQELLTKLYRTESLIMTMMNRRTPLAHQPPAVDEKKRMYFEAVRYWNGVIRDIKPDILIAPHIPHSVPTFVLYSIAQVYGVHTLTMEWTWVVNRLLIQQTYEKGSLTLKRLLKENGNRSFTVDDLADDIRAYWEAHIDQDAIAETMYAKYHTNIMKHKHNPWKRLRNKVVALRWGIQRGTLLSIVSQYLQILFGMNAKKEYEKYAKEPDLEKPFVYVALHYQPECSTSPMGEVYADQILMVETVAAALPKGWEVYVKEHPSQWFFERRHYYSNVRYRGYYDRLARIPNVRMVPITTNTFVLTDASKAVATVTGTVATEAVFRGKPALVFGYAWYVDMPGMLRVDSADSCRRALERIKNGYTVRKQELLNYFKSFGDASIEGFTVVNIDLFRRMAGEKNAAIFETFMQTRREGMDNIIRVIAHEAEVVG
jgi:hypothetical protein